MAQLHPLNEEQISRQYRSGGKVIGVSGPRRSGLTTLLDSLVKNWVDESGVGKRIESIDLRQYSELPLFKNEIQTRFGLDEPLSSAEELSTLVKECIYSEIGLCYFQNFHNASSETKEFILSGVLSRSLPHGTGAMANILIEGAVDFEKLAEIIESENCNSAS